MYQKKKTRRNQTANANLFLQCFTNFSARCSTIDYAELDSYQFSDQAGFRQKSRRRIAQTKKTENGELTCGLVVLERHCLALRKEVVHLSERREVLAVLMEGKMNVQKTVPEDFQRQIFQKLKELEEQRTKGSAGTRPKEAQVDQVGR